jgi:glycosyltransferase involved in cell wall biosynthesis
VRVLYASHTAAVSGAERTLLDLLNALPADINPAVGSPAGELADRVRRAGVNWYALPGTAGSLALHPTRTPRAVGEMVRAALALHRLARSVRADLIHANSVRAGLIAGAARRLGGPPVIVHVHDRLEPGRVTSLVSAALRAGADGFLSISGWAEAGLERQRAPVFRVGNPVDIERFHPRAAHSSRPPTIGIVAQVTPWKGQREAIETLIRVRAAQPDARLIIAGAVKFADRSTRFDNHTYLAELRGRVAAASLEDGVDFLGECEDVPDLLARCDVLLVPSWGEPFGRSMIEAMAMGVPVVATNLGGPAEVIEDGVSGVLVPVRDVSAMAAAVGELLANAGLRVRMGAAGRAVVVDRFEQGAYAERVVAAYAAVLSRATMASRPRPED